MQDMHTALQRRREHELPSPRLLQRGQTASFFSANDNVAIGLLTAVLVAIIAMTGSTTITIASVALGLIAAITSAVPVLRRCLSHLHLHLLVHPLILGPAARRVEQQAAAAATPPTASPSEPGNTTPASSTACGLFHARMPSIQALFSMHRAGDDASEAHHQHHQQQHAATSTATTDRGSLASRAQHLAALIADHHALPRAGVGATPGLTTLLARCPLHATREHCFASLAPQLAAAPPRRLAAGLNVRIANEPALDAGGVTRELLSMLASQAGHPAILIEQTDGTLMIRPRHDPGTAAAAGAPPPLWWYEAFGKLLGAAIVAACYGASTCPLPLAPGLRKMATDEHLRADDVRAGNPMLYRLRVDALLEPGGIENVAMALCEEQLTFVSDDEPAVPLVADGATKAVDGRNVHEYVCLLSEHMLCGGARAELHATLKGLWSVVPLASLLEARIDSIDLGMLLAGASALDVEAWARSCKVESANDVTAESATRRRGAFFRVLASFDDEMRSRCFAFATGLHRLPATGGFDALSPPFTLQLLGKAFAGRLPVAHTCFNALQLAPTAAAGAAPESGASDEDAALARALTTAIDFGGEGFGLV